MLLMFLAFLEMIECFRQYASVTSFIKKYFDPLIGLLAQVSTN
ncbi:uncharacterized protein METZ01_LOCUS267026 [marine metagenome]|uniref:Uncharacterized protein n=1 Tax=marine metagenome TaxID=408172 RepID=A0A382JS60_9ZZZZ